MNFAKSFVTILLSVAYLCLLAALTLECEFPDGTKICYEGWMF